MTAATIPVPAHSPADTAAPPQHTPALITCGLERGAALVRRRADHRRPGQDVAHVQWRADPGEHAGRDSLGDLNIVVRELYRFQPEGTTADQPGTWSVLEFDVSDDDAPDLADAFASVLRQPGWQVDFRSPAETFVVFPGRVFRYPRGDAASRAEAQAYGRSVGVPEPQLDWPA